MLTIPVPFGFVRVARTTSGLRNLGGGYVKNIKLVTGNIKTTKPSSISDGSWQTFRSAFQMFQQPHFVKPCQMNTNTMTPFKPTAPTISNPR